MRYPGNKPPKSAEWILGKTLDESTKYAALGDFEEKYVSNIRENGLFWAKYLYWLQLLSVMPVSLFYSSYWGFSMFKNYLKITYRNIKKHKGYSLINIFGLAAGIVCCTFIMLYVNFESGYDSYHNDVERIYRVAELSKSTTGDGGAAAVHLMIGPTLKSEFPQVEYMARIRGQRKTSVRYGDKVFKEDGKNLRHIDPDLLKIFTFPFIKGDPETALDRPFTMIITEGLAEKYFGRDDPLGKSLKVDTTYYEVTGVVENSPGNTHFKYKFLMSWKSIENDRWMNGWQSPMNVPTYVKLKEGTDPAEFEKNITTIAYKYMGDYIRKKGKEYIGILQPVESIHLHSNLIWEMEPPGNSMYIYIFSAVGALIFLIACMNYINLSTARSANRAGEVGLRKVIGAQRFQLVSQFIGESVVLTVLAYAAAFIFTILLIPFFNEIAGTTISFKNLFNPQIILVLTGMFLFAGLVAGGYPAFFLSTFKPAAVMKGSLNTGTKGGLVRKILVVGQFAISIALITGTIIFYHQLNYMKNADLGFDKEHKLVLNMQGLKVANESYKRIKTEFLQHPDITGATFSSSVPGRWRYLWRQWPTGEEKTNAHALRCMQVDHDFISEYGLKVIAGRPFSREMENFSSGSILNETAVRTFGWKSPEEALKKTMFESRSPIIGVIKDYHFQGLQGKIEPLKLFLMNEDFVALSLKINSNNISGVISFIQSKFLELFPEGILDYAFLDEDFNRLYASEEKLVRIFSIFVFFGVFIACLGLFGLISFIAEQRTQEIGIRKVLGASISGIIFLLTKEFIKLVAIGTVLAWPAAWFGTERWLQDFAYRINPGILSFIFAAVIALIISAATVGWQTFKAAKTNPADALKYE